MNIKAETKIPVRKLHYTPDNARSNSHSCAVARQTKKITISEEYFIVVVDFSKYIPEIFKISGMLILDNT